MMFGKIINYAINRKKKETLLSKIISELMKLDDRYNYELEVKRITKKEA